MENEQKHPPSHEEREVQTLVERIEQMEVAKEAARVPELISENTPPNTGPWYAG